MFLMYVSLPSFVQPISFTLTSNGSANLLSISSAVYVTGFMTVSLAVIEYAPPDPPGTTLSVK